MLNDVLQSLKFSVAISKGNSRNTFNNETWKDSRYPVQLNQLKADEVELLSMLQSLVGFNVRRVEEELRIAEEKRGI